MQRLMAINDRISQSETVSKGATIYEHCFLLLALILKKLKMYMNINLDLTTRTCPDFYEATLFEMYSHHVKRFIRANIINRNDTI